MFIGGERVGVGAFGVGGAYRRSLNVLVLVLVIDLPFSVRRWGERIGVGSCRPSSIVLVLALAFGVQRSRLPFGVSLF